MTELPAGITEMLTERRIGALATVNADGTPHQVSVWFDYQGDYVDIPTPSNSRKAKNVKAGRPASLMVDIRRSDVLSGASITGNAELLDGEQARTINARITRQYLSPEALADPDIIGVFEEDDATIRIHCDSVTTWNMNEALALLFERNGYVLPLADEERND